MVGDLLLQYPTNAAEMLVPAGARIIPVQRRINRLLKFIAVSIPDNGTMTVESDNLTELFFSGESGCIEFPGGLHLGETKIILTNTNDEPARFNYRMVFSD